MNTICATSLLACVLAPPGFAQVKLPNSTLHYGMATNDESGGCKIFMVKFVTVQRTRGETFMETVTREVDGKTVTEEVPKQRTVQYLAVKPETELIIVPFESIEFSSASGKRVTDLASIKRHLAKPKPVVVLEEEEQLLDPYFKQLVRDNTIVLKIKKAAERN